MFYTYSLYVVYIIHIYFIYRHNATYVLLKCVSVYILTHILYLDNIYIYTYNTNINSICVVLHAVVLKRLLEKSGILYEVGFVFRKLRK